MKLHFRTAVLSLLAVLLVFGSVDAQSDDTKLTVYAGATFFNDPELDSVTLVEFPFTLNRSQFEFYRPDSLDSRYYARIFAQVTLFGVDGLPLDSANTYFSAAVDSLAEVATKDIKLFNSLALLVKPGIYSARMTVIDAVSKARGEFFYDKMIVEPAIKDKLSIGGKCLAYNITRAPAGHTSENDRLVKNGLRVLCNPLGIFGATDTVAYFYAELYNLQYDPETPSTFQLAFKVLDEKGEVYSDLGYKSVEKGGSTAVIAQPIDITYWPTGVYYLQVKAADPLSAQSDSQQVAISIMTPETVARAAGVSERYHDPYDTLALDVQLNLVYYLLTPVEKEALKGLNAQGKSTFLKQYWRDHDSDPTTPFNETRLEELNRYEFSNNRFSTNTEKTDGWKSDRGRIYMTYGPWEERDDVESPRVGNPFEVWYYHSIREGAVFVFEDLQGFRDYTLVHSNVEGERHDSDWENRLRQDIYNLE